MNLFNKLRTAEGWAKLNILFAFLIFLLFITTIGQLFFAKDVTLNEVVKNVLSGTYRLGQYVNYAVYVIVKMFVIISPTIGAALLIRAINYKDTLNIKAYKIASTGGIVVLLIAWVVSLFLSYMFKIYVEERYLSADVLTDLEQLFQLYDIVLPALALTFIDNTFTEIRSAEKIKSGKKLDGKLEKELVEIFSDERFTKGTQQHLLNNLKKQADKQPQRNH